MTESLRRKLTNAGRVLSMQDQGDFIARPGPLAPADDKSRGLTAPAPTARGWQP